MSMATNNFYHVLGMRDMMANLFALIYVKGEKETLIEMAKEYQIKFEENPYVEHYLKKFSNE